MLIILSRFSMLGLVAMATLGSTLAAQPVGPSLMMSQWVRHEVGSPLRGTIVLPQSNGITSPIGRATVALADEDGIVQVVESDDGTFLFEDVLPGIYSISARGERAFSIFAVHVVASDSYSNGLPMELEIPAATIDFATINSALVKYLPNGNPMPAVSMATRDMSRLSSRVLGSSPFQVVQSGGGMKGVIYRAGARGELLPPAGFANVFVYSNSKEVARAVTDEDGRFVIDNLPVGQYSLLGLGTSGIGLVGFELIPGNDIAAGRDVDDRGETLVTAMVQGGVPQFGMQLAPIPGGIQAFNGVVTEDVLLDEQVIGEDEVGGFGFPIPGGGYAPNGFGGGFGGGGPGGGGFGGGGGGLSGVGGGGGLLGLAAAGGIAAAAIAASDDNNDNFFAVPPVASPSE